MLGREDPAEGPVDRPLIEGTEPALYGLLLQQFLDQLVEILYDLILVVDEIVILVKVERVVEGRGGKFHAQ